MPAKRNQPKWWLLYLMLPILAAAFLLEMRLRLTSTEHILAQLGILFVIYGFVHWWLRANSSALMHLDEPEGTWQIRVYEIPPAELPRASNSQGKLGSSFPLPDAETKGVLSTTFEMDPVDEDSVFQAGSEMLYSEEILNVKETRDSAD
jgi:hypothetical protein